MDSQPALPKLILHEGSSQGQEIELSRDEFYIGRESLVDLVIPSPAVSRRHARIYRQDDRYWIQDLGSSNKTYVNDEVVDSPRPLQSGDRIRLGSVVQITFTFPGKVDRDAKQAISETYEEVAPGGQAETMLGEMPAAGSAQPPQLILTVAGGTSRTIPLEKSPISLGRSHDNDVVVNSPIVSSHHALLEKREAGYVFVILPNTTNPVYFQGAPIQGEQILHDGDIVRFGSQDPGMMVTLVYEWPAEATLGSLSREIVFGDQDSLQIGRDASCDIVLDAPNVSRFHAVVTRVGQRLQVRDLKSTNGTFVNDQRIEAAVWLKPEDSLRIGPCRFKPGAGGLSQLDDGRGMRVEVLGLNKWVRPDLNLLKDISLIFEPREFVVVVGQSGGGKSTLVDAIAGYRPATHGQVLVNDVDIYRHFDAIRNEIGFVPQKDIIHMELSVYQALDYAARLRLAADTTPEERQQRVMEVLHDLDLVHRRDVPISGLSGGQQKRVSIGVELLTRPGLFFLDEPSSGLDPGTETALMHLMRRLADQGRTIILITHATKNVMLADKVVFLARGGYLAWFGPPDEALKYFDQFRSERDRRTRPMEFDEIYAILDDPGQGSAEEWAQRYRQSPFYQSYILQPLQAHGKVIISPDEAAGTANRALSRPETAGEKPVTSNAIPRSRKAVSGLRQFAILSSRNIHILMRDRISLILMLATAPLVATVDLLLAAILGRDLFSFQNGNMANAMTTLFQPATFAAMVGALSTMREFVKESEIFRRERLVNLRVLPYVLSKVWVAALLALYQALAYTGIHYLGFKMPGGALEFSLMLVTLTLATLAGMAMGFLASALSPNANAAPLIVILFIVPQVVLGGALIPVPTQVSAPITTRWAFEALVSISGAGSDVAADSCWALPEATRNAMSLEDKTARGCRCMGVNALHQATCNFPGIGSLYDPVIDQPKPSETSQADAAALQAAVADWEVKRNTVVSRAESLIGRFQENFGWAFVDKHNPQAFWTKIVTTWGVQALIIIILMSAVFLSVSFRNKV